MPRYSLRHVRARGFGPFGDLDVDFSPTLNVVLGDNGTGKSQMLKLLYVCSSQAYGRPDEVPGTKTSLNRSLADKLVGVFRPDTLGRLTNRQPGRSRADVRVKFDEIANPLAFSFASNSRSEVSVSSLPSRGVTDPSVFLPARELMSIYPNFVSTYNERLLEFDETLRDTADLLGRAPLKGPRSEEAADVLQPIEAALGGRVSEHGGRFYLQQPGLGNLEMHLLAEGLRKLAMIVRPVQSGTLLNQGHLYWDEPEAGLNPATLRSVAQVIIELAQSGVQVFVATHSLFLLRELTMVLPEEGFMRVIGLARDDGGVTAQSGNSADDLDLRYLSALSEEIDQSDRYVESAAE